MSIGRQPRALHLEGSGLPAQDQERIPFSALLGHHLVIEEKVDDSHLSAAFAAGALRLSHRSALVAGELEFAPVKALLSGCQPELLNALGERYELHGGSLHAKHTVFYDALPAWFVEYDVYDHEVGEWLSTERRRELLSGLPLHSAPVLYEGLVDSLEQLEALVAPSRYKSAHWRPALAEAAQRAGAALERVLRETDDSDCGEGLYVKVEEDGRVVTRYKWVRRGFLESLLASGSHWRARSLVVNGLSETTASS